MLRRFYDSESVEPCAEFGSSKKHHIEGNPVDFGALITNASSLRRGKHSAFLYLDAPPPVTTDAPSIGDISMQKAQRHRVLGTGFTQHSGHFPTSFRNTTGAMPEPGAKEKSEQLREPFAKVTGPPCGCGSVACPEQFYVRWSGDWKVLADLHKEEDTSDWFINKMPWIFVGFIPAFTGIMAPKVLAWKNNREFEKTGSESGSGSGSGSAAGESDAS